MSSAGRPLRVCIAAKVPRDRAETFIRAHVDRLPFDVRVLAGIPPHTDERDGFILGRPLAERVGRKFLDRLRPTTDEAERVELTARWLRRSGTECVLAEYGEVAVRMLDPCLRAGVPLVAHFHGHDAYDRGLLVRLRDDYGRLFAGAAAVVAVSRDMVRQLTDLGCPPAKLHYVSYFVDPTRFLGGDPAAAGPHFVGVGRFVETKAPYLTLLAFAKVRESVPDARLTLAGDGVLLPVCMDLATELGVADAVTFPGNLDHEAVAGLLRSARAFVQHSVTCRDGTREGTPNAVLEALASGLPIVATRHAGIPDAVADGETGFLVDERDVDGMASAMAALAGDADLAGRMGAAGRERVAAAYSFGETIGRLAAVIGKAAAANVTAQTIELAEKFVMRDSR